MIRYEWDTEVDALYIRLSSDEIVTQTGDAPILADLSSARTVVGIEILFPITLAALEAFLEDLNVPDDFAELISQAVGAGNLHALSKHQQTRGSESPRIEMMLAS